MLKNPFFSQYSDIRESYRSLFNKNSFMNKVCDFTVFERVMTYGLTFVIGMAIMGMFSEIYNIEISETIATIVVVIPSTVFTVVFFQYFEKKRESMKTKLLNKMKPDLKRIAVTLRDYYKSEEARILLFDALSQKFLKKDLYDIAIKALSDDQDEIYEVIRFILYDGPGSFVRRLDYMYFNIEYNIRSEKKDNEKEKIYQERKLILENL